jgi:predicted PurR-regulated permease PerM
VGDATTSESGPGSRRRRLIFFTVSGLAVVGILLLFGGVLLPFLLAIIVAYVLAPIVQVLQRVMPRWVAVVVLYIALLGGLAGFVAVAIPRLAVEMERMASEVPGLVRTVRDDWIPSIERTFRDQMAVYGGGEHLDRDPDLVELAGSLEIRDGVDGGVPLAGAVGMDGGVPAASPAGILILPVESGGYEVHLPPGGIVVHPEDDDHTWRIATERPPKRAKVDLTTSFSEAFERTFQNTEANALVVIKTAQAVIRAVIKGIFTFFIMLMISAYLLITSDRIFAFMRSLVRPERQPNFDSLLKRIDRGLSGVVRGQLLIALVNGVLSGIGFYLFDLRYWPVLTLVATVLSIIPIFGSIISSIPAVIIGLQDGIGTALLVLAWIVGIHQLEANVLNPKIMGDAAQVHPVLVVFALLAGEHVYGIIGALLAVPVLSIVQSLFLHFREIALGVPARITLPPPEPAAPSTGPPPD